MSWVLFYSFWFYPLAGSILLYAAKVLEPQHRPVEMLWLLPAGLLIWTLIEYCMHRFLFHWKIRNRKLKNLLWHLHIGHHAEPRDPEQILVPPSMSIPISGVLLGGLYLVLGSLFWAIGVIVGTWIGFLYYESVHYRLHRSAAEEGLLHYQRRRHFYHHFVDGETCFGVTSPLWDFVFGTFARLPD
ncbi:MAG TPA: sterol desaturase family protein [Acidobacteriota bacterium]|jgi:sterol desaturase/sphingolipid hydroxylase (fatty acid hydroxylase superfamily)